MESMIDYFIKNLTNEELEEGNWPEEILNHPAVIAAERKRGLRKISFRGYDVITGRFFVVEELSEKFALGPTSTTTFFDNFKDYSSYLNNRVYENSCYYGLDFKILPKRINLKRLFQKNAFVEKTIDDFTFAPSKDEIIEYAQGEENKVHIKQWVKRFNACQNVAQLKAIEKEYTESSLYPKVRIEFFLWNYIFSRAHSVENLKIILEYISSLRFPVTVSPRFTRALCAIFPPEEVAGRYNHSHGTERTRRKHVCAIKKIAKQVINNEFSYEEIGRFDDVTHYFCVEKRACESGCNYPSFSYIEYFDSFESFLSRRNNDLRNCDLSKARNIKFDFSKCVKDGTTRLPLDSYGPLKYIVEKQYTNEQYVVQQKWIDQNGTTVKEHKHVFAWFFDFKTFLKGDFSGADLLSCDGLVNLPNLDGINLKNALLTSAVCEKFGLKYKKYAIPAPAETTLSYAETNEEDCCDLVDTANKQVLYSHIESGFDFFQAREKGELLISYISDIHFHHLLRNRNAVSYSDVIRIVRDVAKAFKRGCWDSRFLLIAGDVSLNFEVFELFVKELRESLIDNSIFARKTNVIFTLGNHDLWSCPDNTLDEIVEKYRSFLSENGMYLLHNDILFFEENEQPGRISESDLNDKTPQNLRELTRTAKLVFFGGIGFAGYEPKYNASCGLYRYNKTIGYNREFEIAETKKFELLYNKVCEALYDKNVIVMTHFPINAWHASCRLVSETELSLQSELCQPGFVYVNGHTHKNVFYDDGETRIFADNQFGYNLHTPDRFPRLQEFVMSGVYDYFKDYADGIYTITPDEYRAFYRGKHLKLVFNRQTNIIHMLKKNGYYCFIHESAQGNLCILSGGALKRLPFNDIYFYYNNMDAVIASIKNPLDKYYAFQRNLSEEIKRIGGEGKIHGCIVDIDYFNHIYVNPSDGSLTAYWANDIRDKLVYPTVITLLKARLPALYYTYTRVLESGDASNVKELSKQQDTLLTVKPEEYFGTDIYVASREISKLQRLNANVLTAWPDNPQKGKLINE